MTTAANTHDIPGTNLPFWALFTKFTSRPERYRCAIEVILHDPLRAKALRRALGYGRVASGRVIFEGAAMLHAMEAFGFPSEVVAYASIFLATKKGRGMARDLIDLREQAAALEKLQGKCASWYIYARTKR